ncbi:MAG: HlyD family efflux transporter periplasmic adaptor subunit [Pirellulaceae bacterium]
MTRVLVIVGVLLAVVVVAAAAVFSLSGGVSVQAAKVQRGEVREFIDERGKTHLPRTYQVSMPYGGRIEPIELVEGQPVEAGQVVARIVPSDLADEVAEAKAAVERLDASIAENQDHSVEMRTREQAQLFHESMQSTVEAAEARLRSGMERLNYAESFLGRIRKLVPSGAKTEDDVQRAELQHVEAGVDYQQDALVAKATKSIEAATALLPKLVTDYIARKDLSREVLEKQKSEAMARLRQAQTRQQRGTMTSPVDGVVLEREESNERYLAAGTILIEIGRLEDLEVEAEVLSQDVVRVDVGDTAIVYGPAAGRDVEDGIIGRVKRVNPAGFTKISSLGVEQQRVMVIVELAPGDLETLRAERDIGVDYQVRVRIITDEKSSALTVPRSAVFRSPDGGWQVFAIRAGAAKLVNVELGLRNDDRVEITEGLEADELVVLAPESSLTDGARVTPMVRD